MLDRLAQRYGCRPSSIVGWEGPVGLALDFSCMEAGGLAAKRAIGDGMVFPVAIVAS